MTGTESVLVSLGSNIEPLENLRRAVALLGTRFELAAVSRPWRSPPVGSPASPMFLNAAVELFCGIDPARLKYGILRPLEGSLGRVRGPDRNAPRTIDLDIALFGDRVIEDAEAGLSLPDPDILRHAHVALPLAEIAPSRVHPVVDRTLAEIAADFGDTGELRVLEETSLRRRDRPEGRP